MQSKYSHKKNREHEKKNDHVNMCVYIPKQGQSL